MKNFFLVLFFFKLLMNGLMAELPTEVKDIVYWKTTLGADHFGVTSKLTIRLRKSLDSRYKLFDNYLLISESSKDFTKSQFKINSSQLIDGEEVVSFDEIFNNATKLSGSEILKMRESALARYNFLKISIVEQTVEIKVEDFFENILVINYKDKIHYIRISKEDLEKNGLFFHYINLYGEKTKQQELETKLNSYGDLNKLVGNLKNCAKNRDADCFIKYRNLESVEQEKAKESFKKNVLLRFIQDDEAACAIYKSTRSNNYEGDNHFPPGIEKKLDNTKSKVWDSIEKALSLDLNYDYIKLESDNLNEGINLITITKRPRKDLGCGNITDTDIVLKKVNGHWLLEELVLSSEPQYY